MVVVSGGVVVGQLLEEVDVGVTLVFSLFFHLVALGLFLCVEVVLLMSSL